MDVSKVIDGLTRLGTKVVHSGLHDVHATGHAKQEEIKTLLSVTEPQWLIPVHGEYRHLVAHAELGQAMVIPEARTLVCEVGDQIPIDDDGVSRTGSVPAGFLFVHVTGEGVDEVGLRPRRRLCHAGWISADRTGSR